jgi:hypothetical protein
VEGSGRNISFVKGPLRVQVFIKPTRRTDSSHPQSRLPTCLQIGCIRMQFLTSCNNLPKKNYYSRWSKNQTLPTSTKYNPTPQISMLNNTLYIASSAFTAYFFVHRTQARSPKTTLIFRVAGVTQHSRGLISSSIYGRSPQNAKNS